MGKDHLTKEERREYNKKWRLENADYNKKWRATNKDKVEANRLAAKDRKTLLYYIVYCLPNHIEGPYAGMTNQPYMRMTDHKRLGRDTSEWFILDVCLTKEEAKKSEDAYHDQGYRGARKKN